jgi:hypothetical protein
MTRRAAADVTTGVLGITRFGNWQFLAISSTYEFITGRHGAANDRSWRLRAYSQLRYSLLIDQSLSADLRGELTRKLDRLSLNPLDQALGKEEKIAHSQYYALLAWARAEDGLGRQLAHDRRREMHPLVHGAAERTWITLGHIASLGLYRHVEREDPALLAALDHRRRIETYTDFLEEVIASGPRADVVWDMDEVQRSITQLAAIEQVQTGGTTRANYLLGKLLSRIDNPDTRAGLQRILKTETVGSGAE